MAQGKSKDEAWDKYFCLAPPASNAPANKPRCDSTYKWVQTGRVTLSDENARMLVYKLGWGWPPVSDLAEEARNNAAVEADPAMESARAQLQAAANALASDAAAEAAAEAEAEAEADAAAGAAGAAGRRTSPRTAARPSPGAAGV